MSGVRVATSCYRLSSSFRTLLPHTQRLLRTLPSSVTASHARLSLVRSLHSSQVVRMPVTEYSAEERGTSNTDSYQVFIKDSQGPISPFHDIPLWANCDARTFHIVVEIPRWTNAKMEIATQLPLSPIVQDQKKGKLRYVANSFPHHGYIWNYGALPQTWENPHHRDQSTQCMGDNDPVDVCEIGHRVAKRGDVLEVKVLGLLAMIDDGETDWKVMVIDVNDPQAKDLNNLEDVERLMPGFLAATRDWFRIYKIPDGKPENKFAFDGEYQGPEFAHKIIQETHGFWRQLVGLEGEADQGKLDVKCVAVEGAREVITREEANNILSSTEKFTTGPELDSSVDTWHYKHL